MKIPTQNARMQFEWPPFYHVFLYIFVDSSFFLSVNRNDTESYQDTEHMTALTLPLPRHTETLSISAFKQLAAELFFFFLFPLWNLLSFRFFKCEPFSIFIFSHLILLCCWKTWMSYRYTCGHTTCSYPTFHRGRDGTCKTNWIGSWHIAGPSIAFRLHHEIVWFMCYIEND